MRQRLIPAATLLAATLGPAASADAFCGFYVARADATLVNDASQVVLVRDAERTVITMANDYRGDVADFAMVVPVPEPIERGQVHVADPALIDRLDAYTAPRLVEYHDRDPCLLAEMRMLRERAAAPAADSVGAAARKSAAALGVHIEASFAVGEYDILILSAEQSDGLVSWLSANGYRLPRGAAPIVASYLARGMRFFVAKVDLETHRARGAQRLRPLQIAFESSRFMLPIRLGTLNADGAQELFVYALTRTGRVETTNYRTVRVPSGIEIPAFVRDDFARFYGAMFRQQSAREDGRAVFLEYAWDMRWCDPCAADPLSASELRALGVHWLAARPKRRSAPRPGGAAAPDVFVTRLHLRYDAERFPEDLSFHETGDRSNFQGRYVIRHAFDGPIRCPLAREYRERSLPQRRERAARALARLTGWDLATIRERIGLVGGDPTRPWWRDLWPQRD